MKQTNKQKKKKKNSFNNYLLMNGIIRKTN